MAQSLAPNQHLANPVSAPLLKAMVGHQQIVEKLFRAQRQQHLPSTFLFVGPEGVGRKKLALALAQSLVCEKPPQQEWGGCGFCGPCRRMAQTQSEALLILAPEKNQIKIEQSRRVLDFLSLQSLSRARIVIVDSAHLMNPQAANALLKIFEEPPANCYFFLIAPSARHVLPTLRSRSQVVRFLPLTVEEMRSRSPAADWALRASQGSFSRLSHFQDVDELQARDQAGQFLQLFLTDHLAFVKPEWKEMVRDRGHAMNLIRHVQLLLRDGLLAKTLVLNTAEAIQAHPQLINNDKSELIFQLEQQSVDKLHSAAYKAMRLERDLLANADVQLAFEEFWLS